MKPLRVTSSIVVMTVFALAMLMPISASAAGSCPANQGWEVQYTLQFPPAYWTAGPHENDLMTTDASGSSLNVFTFLSTVDAPIYPGQVRIGFFGIHSISAGGLHEINPAQDSFMQVTFGGTATRSELVALTQNTLVQFRWDGGNWVTVQPGPVTCAPGPGSGQVGYYFRQWPIH